MPLEGERGSVGKSRLRLLRLEKGAAGFITMKKGGAMGEKTSKRKYYDEAQRTCKTNGCRPVVGQAREGVSGTWGASQSDYENKVYSHVCGR